MKTLLSRMRKSNTKQEGEGEEEGEQEQQGRKHNNKNSKNLNYVGDINENVEEEEPHPEGAWTTTEKWLEEISKVLDDNAMIQDMKTGLSNALSQEFKPLCELWRKGRSAASYLYFKSLLEFALQV